VTLFVFNLAAIVCALRAASLIFSVRRIYLPRNGGQATWEMSEAAGSWPLAAFALLPRSSSPFDILIVCIGDRARAQANKKGGRGLDHPDKV
jgi:hypothetical protein